LEQRAVAAGHARAARLHASLRRSQAGFTGAVDDHFHGSIDPQPKEYTMSQVKVLNPARPHLQRSLRWALLATFVAVSSATALSAWAQPMGGMMGGHEGHGGMHGGPEHIGRMLDNMLDGLNATDAQRAQIKQIAQAAETDLKAQHEAGRALHEKQMQIFTAPNVDAAAAESVRAQLSAQHDQASRRTMQAMLDASRVLTPDQRAKLGERMKQREAQMHDRMQRMERERPAAK
jgi:Spy/CpxP family protein refolding chaperone